MEKINWKWFLFLVLFVLVLGIIIFREKNTITKDNAKDIYKNNIEQFVLNLMTDKTDDVEKVFSNELKSRIKENTISSMTNFVDGETLIKIDYDDDIEVEVKELSQKGKYRITCSSVCYIQTNIQEYYLKVDWILRDDLTKDNVGIRYVCLGTMDILDNNIMTNYENVDCGIIVYKGKNN